MPVTQFSEKSIVGDFSKRFPGLYVVTARAEDPFFRPARARLIWANHTTAAAQALGMKAGLMGNVSQLRFNFASASGRGAVARQRYYGRERVMRDILRYRPRVQPRAALAADGAPERVGPYAKK